MKRIVPLLAFMIVILISFAAVSSAEANVNVKSSADLISYIDQLKADGEFTSDSIARSLSMHMTSVNHFEQKNETDKVIQHLEGFLVLLENYAENQLISDEAFEALSAGAEKLLRIFGPLDIIHDGEANAVIIGKEVFSSEIRGWIPKGKLEKISIVDTNSNSGTKSVVFNNDVAGEPMGLESRRVKVTEGESYELKAMYYLSSNPAPRGSVAMYIRFFDANNVRISSQAIGGRVQDEWSEISLAQVAPEGAVEAHIYLYADSTGPRLMYWDDISFGIQNSGENLLTNGDFELFSYDQAQAIDALNEYVEKSTDAQIPVVLEAGEENLIEIYVGQTHADDQAAIDAQLEGLDPQGFVIFPNENRLTIIGPTDTGTLNGVYDFLERYVEVRWLFPGEHGEDVPQLSDVQIPRETVRDEPFSTFRMLSPMQGGRVPLAEWAGKNKLQNSSNTTLKFHHNIYALFPVEEYGESNPEFYPNGTPPNPGVYTTWQPCFSEEGTIPVAVAGIIDYFDKNPNANSYSLGINDSRNFCETNPEHPAYTGIVNSGGDLDVSDVYYAWVNEVVSQVTQVYPDKWFGLLAYNNVFDPPSFPLHPNVVPVITKDRMTWIADEVRIANQEHQQAWNEKASQIAWYDYMYGTAYAVPRVYPQMMAENYAYAAQTGVFGHYAEIYTNLGEGPKAWLSARLQWDPTQDVDELLQEWYERAVGEAAAEDLAAYFEIWEDFWMERVEDLPWFQNRKNNMYLLFTTVNYLSRVTEEDLALSRQLMESVVAKAETDAQKTRANMLMSTFEYYEATALSYGIDGDIDVPADEQAAIEILDYIKQSLQMAEKRHDLMEAFKSDPALEFTLVPRYDWNGVQYRLFVALQEYVEQEPEGGLVGQLVEDFLDGLPHHIRGQFMSNIPSTFEAFAKKTTESPGVILQSLDFSQGPWTEAIMFNDYLVMGSSTDLPLQETRTYLLWDDENLYVGYENLDDKPSAIKASDSAPNSWWSNAPDDSVETYVTGDANGSFKGFFTNPKGVSFVRQQDPDTPQRPVQGVNWQMNAAILDDRWNVIQVIPFAEIGVDPSETDTLMGLFFRNLHGRTQYIGWGGGAPWTPSDFKPIYLVE